MLRRAARRLGEVASVVLPQHPLADRPRHTGGGDIRSAAVVDCLATRAEQPRCPARNLVVRLVLCAVGGYGGPPVRARPRRGIWVRAGSRGSMRRAVGRPRCRSGTTTASSRPGRPPRRRGGGDQPEMPLRWHRRVKVDLVEWAARAVQEVLLAQLLALAGGVWIAVADGFVERDRVGPAVRIVVDPPPASVAVERTAQAGGLHGPREVAFGQAPAASWWRRRGRGWSRAPTEAWRHGAE